MTSFITDGFGQYITKDPNENLDYEVDWTDFLDGDTITAVAWEVPAGVTETQTSNSVTSATIWLSGGTTPLTYEVACKITTAAGRIAERSFRLQIVDK